MTFIRNVTEEVYQIIKRSRKPIGVIGITDKSKENYEKLVKAANGSAKIIKALPKPLGDKQVRNSVYRLYNVEKRITRIDRGKYRIK